MSTNTTIPYLEFFPTDALVVDVSYALWTQLVADPIVSATVTAVVHGTATAALTIGTPAVQSNGLDVYVKIGGAVAGKLYDVTCVGTTASGQTVTGGFYIAGVSL